MRPDLLLNYITDIIMPGLSGRWRIFVGQAIFAIYSLDMDANVIVRFTRGLTYTRSVES